MRETRNREIIFRGKRTAGARIGEWTYGDLVHALTGGMVITETGDVDAWEVDPGTVGQYTGLLDKNGARIFEGDIINICLRNSHDPRSNIVPPCNEAVIFENQSFGVIWGNRREFARFNSFTQETIFEVVGTVHDNPELLAGAEREG
jgi:uncharacterized phage protein (TIGR01671 family)